MAEVINHVSGDRPGEAKFLGRLSGEGKCPLTVKIAVAAENGDVVGVM